MTQAPQTTATSALDLYEVALALSDALDLVGVEDVHHGKRVAYLATRILEKERVPEAVGEDLFTAALLHDCGVSSSRVHQQLLAGLDWEGAPEHCLAGHELLRGFPPFARIAEAVLLHHTRWDEAILASAPPDIALLANAIFLADRTDVLVQQARGKSLLVERRAIRRVISGLAGTWFSPALVASFLAASEPEAFWLGLETHHLMRWVEETSRRGRHRDVGKDELKRLATIFARIVDAKSPFTARHSLGVARLARLLSEIAALPEEVRDEIEIAGLLHDLGKLRVSDAVLEKNGPLGDAERAEIARHTFETFQILRRVGPFRRLASWAGAHHEGLRGSGYPFHTPPVDITLPARIVAVADVFQALAQDRPYRSALPTPEILARLDAMASAGHLDPRVVGLVAENADACYEAAVSSEARDPFLAPPGPPPRARAITRSRDTRRAPPSRTRAR